MFNTHICFSLNYFRFPMLVESLQGMCNTFKNCNRIYYKLEQVPGGTRIPPGRRHFVMYKNNLRL